VAMSVLPLRGSSTLCYGSSDGGKNLHVKDPKIIELMKQHALALNLAVHPVPDKDIFRWIPMPCDMEVHKVREDHYYVVDFARLFPPQPPVPILREILLESGHNVKTMINSHLAYMLRPELVAMFSKPLSSDAFSRFASREHPQFNRDVVDAARYLVNTVIPKLAFSLDEDIVATMSLDDLSKTRCLRQGFTDGRYLADKMHKNGINMRFLGVLYSKVTSPMWKDEILLEAVARCVKSLVRKALREQQSAIFILTAVVTPYIKTTISILNHILGRGTCSQGAHGICSCAHDDESEEWHNMYTTDYLNVPQYVDEKMKCDWKATHEEERRRRYFFCYELKKLLEERFLFDVDAFRSNCCCSCDWKVRVPPSTLFSRACSMLGIETSSRVEQMFVTEKPQVNQPPVYNLKRHNSDFVPKSLFDLFVPFRTGDIKEISGTVKSLPMMEYAQGAEALIAAQESMGKGHEEEAERLAYYALEKFNAGIAMCSTGAQLRCLRGTAYSILNKLRHVGNHEREIKEYAKALRCNRNHARAWYSLGQALDLQHRSFFKHDGDDLLLDFLEKKLGSDFISVSSPLPFVIGKRLKRVKNIDHARWHTCIESCFLHCLQIRPDYVNCRKDYANFCLHSLNNPKRAIVLYEESIKQDPEHIRSYQNLAKLQQKLSKWPESVEALKRCSALDSLNPIIQFDLAFCTQKSGSRTAIKPMLEKGYANMLVQYRKDTELGHSIPRYFDANDPEVHIALAIRSSKLLLKVASGLECETDFDRCFEYAKLLLEREIDLFQKKPWSKVNESWLMRASAALRKNINAQALRKCREMDPLFEIDSVSEISCDIQDLQSIDELLSYAVVVAEMNPDATAHQMKERNRFRRFFKYEPSIKNLKPKIR